MRHTFTLDDAKAIVDYIVSKVGQDATVCEQYSGRGMYGKMCVGVVASSQEYVIEACVNLCIPCPTRIDDMGKDIIIY